MSEGLIVLPLTICFTGNSTFFKLIVVYTSSISLHPSSTSYSAQMKTRQKLTGISGVSKIYFGTHLRPQSLAMTSFTLPTNSGVNVLPGFMSKNNSTVSSIS